MRSLAQSLDDAESMPFGMMRDLQRLYNENPKAMAMFASAIAAPSHTMTVSLSFHGGRLQYGEHKITAK